ncbi:hypothetical protein Hdeb2414_s0017g00509871 [Helianthus debilis subsp. tardiflorus]
MLAGIRRNCRSPQRNRHTITILNTSPLTNPNTLSVSKPPPPEHHSQPVLNTHTVSSNHTPSPEFETTSEMKLAGADGFPFHSTSRNDEALIGNPLLGTRLVSFFKLNDQENKNQDMMDIRNPQ